MSTEEAEKEWDLQANDFYFKSIISSPGSYKQGIKDFKSALREEIENRISKLHMGTPEENEISTLKEVLNLLDTITPKK